MDPGDGDRHEFLPRAAELFTWAIANVQAMLAAAINTYLLKLYNDGWQQDDLPVLDAAGFTARMKLEFLRIDASDLVPVEYGYDPGELFWGHTITVQVDAALRYRGAHLVG